MTPEELDAARARCDAATELWTWHEATDDTFAGWGSHMGQMLYRLPADSQTRDMRDSILATLADLPAALDEITRLRAALDEARAEVAASRRCGEKHPDNPTVVPCVLDHDDHGDGLHWSSTGCAGSTISWPTAEARAEAAESALAAVRALHVRREGPVVERDCLEGDCEHFSTDDCDYHGPHPSPECPRLADAVCAHCADQTDPGDGWEHMIRPAAYWPCATIRAVLPAPTSPERSEADG